MSSLFRSFVHDTVHAWRAFRRTPFVALLAAFVIALAAGETTLIWTVVSAVHQGPAGVRDSGRLVELTRSVQVGRPSMWFSYPEYTRLSQRLRSVSGLAAFATANVSIRAGDQRAVPRALCAMVSANYFDVLGIVPRLGRGFPDAPEARAGQRIAVVSHRFFAERLGGGQSIGRMTVFVNADSFAVVGVLPEAFHGTVVGLEPDVWVPVAAQESVLLPPAVLRDRLPSRSLLRTEGYSWLALVGRLRDGGDMSQIQSELRILSGDPTAGRLVRLAATPLSEAAIPVQLRDSARNLINLFVLMMALFSIAAYANVLLLLVQIRIRRDPEMATRRALGASTGRLVAQLATEGVALVVLASGIGATAVLLAQPLKALLPPLPAVPSVRLQLGTGAALWFLAQILAAGVLCGLIPYFHLLVRSGSPRGDAAAAHRRVGRASAMDLVVVTQTLCAVVLVAWAMVFVRDVRSAYRTDWGFRPDSLLFCRLNLEFSNLAPAQRNEFYGSLVRKVRSIPGVSTVAMADATPLAPPKDVLSLDPRPRRAVYTDTIKVTPEYFRALQVQLLAGRLFTDVDADEVVVLNRSAAEALRRRGAGAGEHQPVLGAINDNRSVIGVIADARRDSVAGTKEPTEYVLMGADPPDKVAIIVRCAGALAQVRAQLLRLGESFPRGVILDSVTAMNDHIAIALWRERLVAGFALSCAILAAILAAVGTCAVSAQSVLMRRRELSIRMAVGATPSAVIFRVVRRFSCCGLIGAGCGVGAVVLLRRLVLLFTTSPMDLEWDVAGGAAAFTLAVVVIASFAPARRLTRLDLSGLLRSQ